MHIPVSTSMSTDASDTSREEVVEAVENLTFDDAQADITGGWNTASDPTHLCGETPSLSLSNWLARPRRIGVFNWATTLDETFSPWNLFFSSPTVIAKIRRFAMFRGDLHLRVVINGSPFLYGRAIVAYQPLGPSNYVYKYLEGNCTSSLAQPIIAYLSQCPHEFLDPSRNHSIELVCPFMTNKNWARLYREDELPLSGDNIPDIDVLGEVMFKSINDLQQGNDGGGSPEVDVTVFAWVENVALAVPTATNISDPATLWLPEGKRSTRRKTRISDPPPDKESEEAADQKLTVSMVASAVADGLGMLTSVPVIGPFAKAGSIASSAVSSVAKIFGFSRPVQLADTHRFYNHNFGNLAATAGGWVGQKLSVDPNNAVTLDPRVTGMSTEDELAIQSLATRESYLTTVTWTDTNAPMTSSATLFRCANTPMLTAVDATNVPLSQAVMEPTPMAFAATPFTYWKGELKYRFQVVASQYHRGKVAFLFEPSMDAQAVLAGVDSLDYNSQFVQVYDIQELDNVEIVIPWASSRPFLECNLQETAPSASGVVQFFPSASTPAAVLVTELGTAANGFVELRVVNSLASASSTPTPIQINVYVSCDNLTVAQPRDVLTSALGVDPAAAPATLWLPEGDVIDGFDTTTSGRSRPIHSDSSGADRITEVLMGETIPSFRSLLKRFDHEYTVRFDTSAAADDGVLVLRGGIYPPQYTYNTALPTDYTKNGYITMFEYLRLAYLAMRGSYRRILMPDKHDQFSLVRVGNDDTITFTPNISLRGCREYPPAASFAGATTNGIPSNQGIMWESPYYSPNRFFCGLAGPTYRLNDVLSAYDFDGAVNSAPYNVPGWDARVTIKTSDSDIAFLHVSAAAGDDFTFCGFLAAPPRYIVVS